MLIAAIDLDGSEPPVAAGWPSLPAPALTRIRAGGLGELVLAEEHAVPLVHLRCVVPAGARWDPPDRRGLASLTLPLLRGGTRRRGADQIADQAELLGADVLAQVGWDRGRLIVELLADDLAFGLELLLDLLVSPSFPIPALDGARRRQVAYARRQLGQPAHAADAWFARTVYAGTPYGGELLGDAASLAEIERQDVVGFHAARCGLQDAVLIAVGSFRAEDLIGELERLAPAVSPSAGVPTPPPLCEVTPLPGTRVCLVDLPGTVQSEIRIGHAAVPRNHPDFLRLAVLGRILGARLGRTLRERLGYTYGVRTQLGERSGPGPFMTAAAVGHANVGAAVSEVVREMDDLKQREVGEAELAEAQQGELGALLRSLQSGHGLAAQLQRLVAYGLADDHPASAVAEIARIAPGDLADAAVRHLQPDRLAIVAAGPARRLREELASWGSPDVVAPAPGE